MKTALPDYSIRRSPRAKNLRLRVTREDGLLVVLPKGYDETKVPALLKQKRVWIADSIQRISETKRFLEPKPITHLPEAVRLDALGKTWRIIYREERTHAGIRLRADNGELVISGPDLNCDAVIRKLKDWLRVQMREGLFPLAQTLATKHRLPFGGLLVKSQRTRWASCSAKRNLSLNTKLLFIAPDLVRYVIIHELCHTVHMNHGKEFWRLVQSSEPSYKVLDGALREAWKRVPQWVF
jgi:predicted metal-dependent hydrolase